MDHLNLFGRAADCDPSRSQWFARPWLAERVATLIPPHARVLDPACGAGNLLEPLLRRGHAARNLMGVERDVRSAITAAHRLGPRVAVLKGDFLEGVFMRAACASFAPEVVVMNPAFEHDQHTGYVLRALELAREVVGIFPASFEFGLERDRELWAPKAYVAFRARVPERFMYGGRFMRRFDSVVVLKIKRRDEPRHEGESLSVFEKVWQPEASA